MQDNSISEKYAFKKIDSIAYKKQVKDLLTSLRGEYEVKEYSFGSSLSDSINFDYSSTSTNIQQAFETVISNFDNRNLGAVILASDGIYNQGVSPLSELYPFQGVLYTVGLGDTTLQKDAAVVRVFANKLVYLGDKFAIRSDIVAYGCEGSPLRIKIFSHNQNRVVAEQNVVSDRMRFMKSIETILDATSAGVQHYSISVSKVDGEQNESNNVQDVYIEVLDSKEQILILANAPHPDVNAIREALGKNKNYKIDIAMADKPVAKLNDYNLIILHNLPSVNFNVSSVVEQSKKLGISLWFIVGQQTAISLFNQYQTALQITPRVSSLNDVGASLNKDFSFFNVNANIANVLIQLPPLSAPFGDFKVGNDAQVLLYQKIGSIQTQSPLWLMQSMGVAKLGVLSAEGLWRWRMYDFLQNKKSDATDELISKTVTYLSVKHNRKQLNTYLQKNLFNEYEPIVVDAELFNENFEIINSADLSLTLIDEKGGRSNWSMNKSGNSYTYNLGEMSEGKYDFVCNTTFNGKNLSSSGSFTVVRQNIEEINTTADFGLLNLMAKNYNGEFVFANQVSSLKDKISKNQNIKNVIHSDVVTEPFIDWKWLLGLLFFTLSLEWYLRKRNGSY